MKILQWLIILTCHLGEYHKKDFHVLPYKRCRNCRAVHSWWSRLTMISLLFLPLVFSGCIREYKLNVYQYSYGCEEQQQVTEIEEQLEEQTTISKEGKTEILKKEKRIYHGRNVVSVYVDASVPKEITTDAALTLKASPLP